MTKPITPEMIAAWRKLRNFAYCTRGVAAPQPWETELVGAIDVLDNSDYMVPIEEAGECGDTSAGLPEPPCSLDKPCPIHEDDMPVGSLDPAEWGDTTREDMARHQKES